MKPRTSASEPEKLSFKSELIKPAQKAQRVVFLGESDSHSVMSDSLRPHLFLFKHWFVFVLNLDLLRCRQILYHLVTWCWDVDTALVLWGNTFPPIVPHSFLPSSTHFMPWLRSVTRIYKATCPRTHTFQSLNSTWNLLNFKTPTQPRSAAYIPSPPALESVSSSFNHPGSSEYTHPTHTLLGNQQHRENRRRRSLMSPTDLCSSLHHFK